MTVAVGLHRTHRAEAKHSGKVSWVSFYDDKDAEVTIFCPAHVAEATAAAFNAAMEIGKTEEQT